MTGTTLLTPRRALWVLRALWATVVGAMALALDGAIDGRGGAARAIPPAAWWVVASIVMVTLVVPAVAGLTALRLLAPLAIVAGVVSLAFGAPVVPSAIAVGVAAVASLLAHSAEIGHVLVQGSAYGDEQRFLLRPPAAFLLPAVITWVVWCAALSGAVLLLGAAQWLVGAALAALTLVVTLVVSQRFHRLSRRWLVLVPAGLVLHDEVVLGETLMVPRTKVLLARLAYVDSDAADLTGPAAGHAVEITVREPTTAVLAATPAAPKGRALHLTAFLVAPTRPGRALQAMADGRVPVG